MLRITSLVGKCSKCWGMGSVHRYFSCDELIKGAKAPVTAHITSVNPKLKTCWALTLEFVPFPLVSNPIHLEEDCDKTVTASQGWWIHFFYLTVVWLTLFKGKSSADFFNFNFFKITEDRCWCFLSPAAAMQQGMWNHPGKWTSM